MIVVIDIGYWHFRLFKSTKIHQYEWIEYGEQWMAFICQFRFDENESEKEKTSSKHLHIGQKDPKNRLELFQFVEKVFLKKKKIYHIYAMLNF